MEFHKHVVISDTGINSTQRLSMVEHATESPKGTQFISPARERWVKIRVSESRRDDTNMPQTYAANFVHCIFSTKDRRDLIPETLQEKLYAYLFGIAKNLRITIIAVGGTANHIHLLISLPPSLPLAEAIQKLKANSSRWLGEQGMRFEWQKGYDAFSVSPSLLTTVQIYIRNQQQHHRKRSFEEEFLALLRKSAIAHDADRLFAA